MNVFTYGSLMYPEVWDRVVRGQYRGAAARLQGWARRAIADASYPGAIRVIGEQIDGRLWFDVDADDLARLDAFESTEYQRVGVRVQLCSGRDDPIEAQLYEFLSPNRLLACDWDTAGFERLHLADFAQVHGAGASR